MAEIVLAQTRTASITKVAAAFLSARVIYNYLLLHICLFVYLWAFLLLLFFFLLYCCCRRSAFSIQHSTCLNSGMSRTAAVDAAFTLGTSITIRSTRTHIHLHGKNKKKKQKIKQISEKK